MPGPGPSGGAAGITLVISTKGKEPMAQYYVDPEDLKEMGRLLKQSFFFMERCGGILSERRDLKGIRRAIDIACGPGQWATALARNFSNVEVVGMDISQRMIEFAAAQALQDGLDNLSFEVGDATRLPLPY